VTYECIVKTGHTGAGNCFEKKIYVKADNILDAMKKAKLKGGVKKGFSNLSGQSILNIKSVNN